MPPATTGGGGSASPSAASSASPSPNPNPSGGNVAAPPSWWESVSRARSRIQSLAGLLAAPDLASLADSDLPARALLSAPAAYSAVAAALSAPSSGSGDDPLCHWLYDTFLAPDPDLRLVTLSFLPLLAALYLARLHSPSAASASLSGFEAVLLAIYSSEVKSRNGRPVLVSVPDLSLPSLYHTPRPPNPRSPRPPSPPLSRSQQPHPSVGVLSPPLEPQIAVKSTKRACIIAVAFDAYYSKIALMPPRSKADLCDAIAAWAGQYCPCRFELDDEDANLSSLLSLSSSSSSSSSTEVRNFGEENDTGVKGATEELGRLAIGEKSNGHSCNGGEEQPGNEASRMGARVPLPWELLQPLLRILGHCLLAPLNPKEVRDAASVAVRCVYARASHELLPQAILGTRSLIQLDKSARKAAAAAALAGAASTGSNATTPSKQKKPEILLVSK